MESITDIRRKIVIAHNQGHGNNQPERQRNEARTELARLSVAFLEKGGTTEELARILRGSGTA